MRRERLRRQACRLRRTKTRPTRLRRQALAWMRAADALLRRPDALAEPHATSARRLLLERAKVATVARELGVPHRQVCRLRDQALRRLRSG